MHTEFNRNAEQKWKPNEEKNKAAEKNVQRTTHFHDTKKHIAMNESKRKAEREGERESETDSVQRYCNFYYGAPIVSNEYENCCIRWLKPLTNVGC